MENPNPKYANHRITILLLIAFVFTGSMLIYRLYVEYYRPQTATELEMTPIPLPTPQIVIPEWNMFANAQFHYSIQHPPDTEPVIMPDSDVYRHFVTFVEAITDPATGEATKTELFSLSLRDGTMEEEVQFQKSRIEGHVPLVVKAQQSFSHFTNPATRIDYVSASGSGELLSFIILEKPPLTMTLYFPNLKDTSLVDQVLSTVRLN